MNNLNDKSNKTATPLKSAEIKVNGQVVEVKINQNRLSVAAKLSSRPSRSLIKAKSIMKPLGSIKKKGSASANS